MRKLKVTNIGPSPAVLKDQEGYSTFKMDVEPGQTGTQDITYNIYERLLPQLRACSGFLRWEIIDDPLQADLNYTNITRPDPTTVAPGFRIFNTNENAPQWSDGANWVDANGNPT